MKLHSHEGFPTRPLMDFLQERGLPLIIHVSERGPLELVPLLKAYREVNVIVAHMGSPTNYYHKLQAI